MLVHSDRSVINALILSFTDPFFTGCLAIPGFLQFSAPQVILYSFYKNIVLAFVLVCFSCYSAFSGQSLYGANSWCYSLYNFFLGLPPFMLGFFDRDVKPRCIVNTAERDQWLGTLFALDKNV
jgi:hypothetical protein